jgi:hypothetical protein
VVSLPKNRLVPAAQRRYGVLMRLVMRAAKNSDNGACAIIAARCARRCFQI